MICAYCGCRPSANQDHVIPRAVLKRYKHVRLPEELLATVPSCFPCNIRKGTRKLVPLSWADRIPQIEALIPGAWRVWQGDPLDPAFREVHL